MRRFRTAVALCALLGSAAGALAWVSATPPLHGFAWDGWWPAQLPWPDIPLRQRGWLLVPAGVLAMVFTACRTRTRRSTF